MKTKKFYKIKERICRIYNHDPGVIKEPHETCPFQIAMRSMGVENDESCHDFIAKNPELAERIAKEWNKTYVIPTNRDVFLKTLQATDCRYTIENDVIRHEDQVVATLDSEWANKKFDEI